MAEKHEQIALFKRAQFNPVTRDYMFAIPNGGSRHPIEAANLKKQGVKPGIPDIFLAYPTIKYHGLWIELKRLNPTPGILTCNQIMWLDKLKRCGYSAAVAYGWEDAWKKIIDYLGETVAENTNK